MANNKSFNIKDKELADALSIDLHRLYEICDFFDADDKDEWDLKYNEHFIWINQNLRKRIFSPQGAYAICRYIDTHEGQNIFRKLTRWLNGRDRRIRSMLVQKKIIEITDENNAIIFHSNRAFITPKYSRAVLGLGTRQDIINRAFQAEMKSAERQPLELGRHFILSENGEKCLSDLGLSRVSANLGQTLTNPHRREWCNLVSEKIGGEIKRLIEDRESRQKRVQQAMQRAKTMAKGHCQITGEKKCAANPINLAAHHVFDQSTYPHLADHVDNILILKDTIHQDFHAWMGGTKETCDVDDLERFIVEFANDLFVTDNSSQMGLALRKIKWIRARVKPLV